MTPAAGSNGLAPAPIRDPTTNTIKPRRHYGRWLATTLILLALAGIVRAFALGQIEWAVVAQFLTAPAILFGLVNTIIMAIAAMLPWVGEMRMLGGQATAYVCRDFVCQAPLTDPAALP